MKWKISYIIIIVLATFLLTSCSLALEETKENNKDELIGIKVILNENTQNQTTQLQLYFDTAKVENLIFGFSNLKMNDTINLDNDKNTHHLELEADVYINKEKNDMISIYTVYSTENEIKEVLSDSTSYSSDFFFSHTVKEEKIINDEKKIRSIKLNFVMIDTLSELMIKEYDINNNMINEAILTDNLVDTYTFKPNANYILITERYIINDEEKKIRSLINTSNLKVFIMKFTNDQGVVELKSLTLIKDSEEK